MAIFAQDAIIPAQNPYPASIIVPAGMTEEQFRYGLELAGVYWYEVEVYRTVTGYMTHVGFVWTGLAIYRKGENVEEGGDPGDVTPAHIARMLSWSEKSPAVVLVDMNPMPASDIFTKFFGEALEGVVGNLPVIGWIIDKFEDNEPVRWLPLKSSIGPDTVHVAWVYWKTQSPPSKTIESNLNKIGVKVLHWYGSYENVPLYTGGTGGAAQFVLAVPDRSVPIITIAKAMKANDIRVSTVPYAEDGASGYVQVDKVADTLFGIHEATIGVIGAAANTTSAAASIIDEFLGDPEKLQFYLKVGLGVIIGAVTLWGISQLVSAVRGGRVSSPMDFSDVGKGGWMRRKVKSKFRRGPRRSSGSRSTSSAPLALPAYKG